MYNLGVCYSDKHNPIKNMKKAIQFFNAASENGDDSSKKVLNTLELIYLMTK